MKPGERIVCAIDVDTADRAVHLVEQLRDHVGVFKIGLELIMAEGVGIVERMRDAGAEHSHFLDRLIESVALNGAGAREGLEP